MTNPTVAIGNKQIGAGQPCYLIAEIGINHNGDLDIAKRLVEEAHKAGWDAVKFQKRTVDIVYTPEELAAPRPNPFGATNGDLKRGLEFGQAEYEEIDRYCKELGIHWFASCWDEQAFDFIAAFNPVAYKIASACITDDGLLKRHRDSGKPVILSTGMADLPHISHAVDILGTDNLVLLHCTSTYPSRLEELNLRGIHTLAEEFGVPVGYSGHEVGVYTSYAAAVLGACAVERHITLDRAMWGSDQAASLEVNGFYRLAEDVKLLPTVLGDGQLRIYDSELPIIKKLRRFPFQG